MISHASVITVCVSDQDKAKEFYTKKLGFEVIQDNPMGEGQRWLEVAPPGADTHVVLHTPPGLEGRIGTFTGIVFTAKNVQETYQEMSGRGVEFTEAPKKQPWGGLI